MKNPEKAARRVQQRVDALIVCFAMTSLGLVSLFLSIVGYFVLELQPEQIAVWYGTSLSVNIVFGLSAIVLFFTSPPARNRLFQLVKEIFTSH